MAGVSGVNGSGDLYGTIASGNRINSAADDASGLAISEKMKEQENGLNQGTENARHGTDVLNIADGALGQITDNLQRIYELSLKASNSFMYPRPAHSGVGRPTGPGSQLLCSFPGENARRWEALGEARPGQSSLSA